MNQTDSHLYLLCCRASLCKTWELLYLCSSAMFPGIEIDSSILDYIHNVIKELENDSQFHTMVLTAFKSLEHSVKNGPRLFVPSQDELEAVLVGKKLTTTLFFLDKTFEDITYDITTTVGEAV